MFAPAFATAAARTEEPFELQPFELEALLYEEAERASEDEVLLPPGIKQCPGCGMLVEKTDGDNHMMCGCEARPAGGNLFKALRGGGCGLEWCWDTLAPTGYGAPGRPAHPRQRRFGRCAGQVDVPCCRHGVRADEVCTACPAGQRGVRL